MHIPTIKYPTNIGSKYVSGINTLLYPDRIIAPIIGAERRTIGIPKYKIDNLFFHLTLHILYKNNCKSIVSEVNRFHSL